MKRPKAPSPEEIKAARQKAGLTQSDAAALIGYTTRAWQDWEAGKRGMRRVLFSLFNDIVAARKLG
jgi:DNA-binding transcriptional regulator YiaG